MSEKLIADFLNDLPKNYREEMKKDTEENRSRFVTFTVLDKLRSECEEFNLDEESKQIIANLVLETVTSNRLKNSELKSNPLISGDIDAEDKPNGVHLGVTTTLQKVINSLKSSKLLPIIK